MLLGTAAGRYPLLLVCPASVLTNWQRELAQWGAFKAAKLHGSGRESALALQGVKDGTIEIMLTTFDTYRCMHTRHCIMF